MAKSNRKITPEFDKQARSGVQTDTYGSHSFHTINVNSALSRNLLRRAYREIYESAFPLKEERKSLAAFLDSLRKGNVTISIVGEGFDTPAPVLKAMSVGYYYKEQDVGLQGYLATSPAFQRQGLGRIMDAINTRSLLRMSRENGGQLKGIFLECNLPGDKPDVMDPLLRIEMYKKWGAVVLPIFYKQPALEKGAEGIELKLLAYPHPLTGKYPSKEAIKGYLHGIYSEYEFNGPPEKNADYLTSLRQLEKLDLRLLYKTGKKPSPSNSAP